MARLQLKKVKKTKSVKKAARVKKGKKKGVASSKSIALKETKTLKKIFVRKLEAEILSNIDNIEVEEEEEKEEKEEKSALEQILFRLPIVATPLIGSPKDVQEKLDGIVLKMQKRPSNNKIFDKIHLYMHGYLVNVVLRKFPYIKGYQTVDIYQETLIALRFKAIPHFKLNKGMSFLNFAKMCIRRHLITLLNTSKTRLKDQSINRAISLDSSPLKDDNGDGKNTYLNIIADDSIGVDKATENTEAFNVTKAALINALSDFEQVVLGEYLFSSTYMEIAKNVSKKLNQRHNTKSIDNALLRIRKKATYLMEHSKIENLPLFML